MVYGVVAKNVEMRDKLNIFLLSSYVYSGSDCHIAILTLLSFGSLILTTRGILSHQRANRIAQSGDSLLPSLWLESFWMYVFFSLNAKLRFQFHVSWRNISSDNLSSFNFCDFLWTRNVHTGNTTTWYLGTKSCFTTVLDHLLWLLLHICKSKNIVD